MIEQASQPHDQANVICQRLKARNIKAVAFIDDAYDPLTVDDVEEGHIEAFWTALQGREQVHEEMRQELNVLIGREVTSIDDIDGDVLLKLWDSRETLESLGEPVGQLFETKIGKLEQVDRITSLIKNQCTVGTESYLEIKTLTSKEDISKIGDASIVFIDYYLGPGDDDDSKQKAVKRAKEITNEIYERYGANKLPLVILMSSAPEVKEQQEQFSRDRGWIIGLFYCVTKDDLEDTEKLGINLGTWIERLDQGTKIQNFVEAVEKSLDSAVGQLKNALKNLSLEDYAYVQDFSLAPNGQPLGEYLLWLLNSYFGRLAFENDEEVRKHQDIISGFGFERLPVNQFMPSANLIEMYDSALFNKAIGDISHHPALIENAGASGKVTVNSEEPATANKETAESNEAQGDPSKLAVADVSTPQVSVNSDGSATDNKETAGSNESQDVACDSAADVSTSAPLVGEVPIAAPAQESEVEAASNAIDGDKITNEAAISTTPLPYLRLGLIFVKDASSLVWMVLNPDCDLAFTPDGKREPTQVVALIAGKLEEMKKKATVVKEPKTDLFKWGDNTYMIEWQVKKIAFPEYRTLLEHFSKDGYTPYALLRLPYALDVQRGYAAHFTRIGMPVAPPIHHPVNVEILYENENSEVGSLLVPQGELAFLTTIRDTSQEGKMKLTCRITTQFGHHLKRAIATLGEKYEQQVQALGDEEAQALRNKLGQRSKRVTELLKIFDELFLTNPSPNLTGRGDGQLVPLYEGKGDVAICRNLTNKAEFKQWQKYLVIVNILDPGIENEILANDEVNNEQ